MNKERMKSRAEVQAPIEYEAKFIPADPAEVLLRLEAAGAEIVKERTRKERSTFNIPHAPRGTFARVRDEGDGVVTMTYKNTTDATKIDGVKEIELAVDSYADGVQFLKALGMQEATHEENYRTEFNFAGAQITLDEWPGLPPFFEVEGKDQQTVIAAATQLGFSMDNALFGNVDTVYQHVLGISLEGRTEITFQNPPTAPEPLPMD